MLFNNSENVYTSQFSSDSTVIFSLWSLRSITHHACIQLRLEVGRPRVTSQQYVVFAG